MNANPIMARGGEAGYILLSVVVVVFVLQIVGAGFLALSGGEAKAVQVNLDSQRAFWLAEAGRQRAIRTLGDPTIWPIPPSSDLVLFQDLAGPDGGTYTVTCLVDPGGAWSAQKQFMLDCVGTSHRVQRRIRQRVQMVSFARYAYFSDDEYNPTVGDIWFTTSDVVEGKIHTNGTFHIYGDPRFQGAVTSSSDHMVGYSSFHVRSLAGWPVGGNEPVFDQGFELGVSTIPLPTQTNDLKSAAMGGGVYIASEAQIELGKRGTSGTGAGTAAPGWLRYRPTSPANHAWTEVAIGLLSNKVFYCNSDLHVQPYSTSTGTLTGELTIASRRTVSIENDIRYTSSNASGTPLPGCRDLLGIVAGRNVSFKDNTANNGGLILDATLMALDTCIQAENWESRPVSTLTIWGGMIQQYRGPVSNIRNGSVIAGFRKNYHYDTRVTARTPPEFPLTGTYEELAWTETWDASDPF